jgi:molybdate transport system substrate-binding protein
MGPPVRLLTLIIICALTACGGSSAAKGPIELSVAAASSLAPVFQELGPEFTAETGIPLVFSFASTGHLAQQIRNGAPFDLFAAADEQHVDMLIGTGDLISATRTHFANGVLVLVAAPESDINTLREALNLPTGRPVIANPEHAPYGLAARQVLERSGYWDELQNDIAYAETVRQATQVVETGNAQYGLVALSTALSSDLKVIPIDAGLYAPIAHVAAVLSNSGDPSEAVMFLEFLTSEAGGEVLRTHGLEPEDGS